MNPEKVLNSEPISNEDFDMVIISSVIIVVLSWKTVCSIVLSMKSEILWIINNFYIWTQFHFSSCSEKC